MLILDIFNKRMRVILRIALAAQSDQGNIFKSEWIIDSRATRHVTGNPKLFREYKLMWKRESFSL